MKHKPLTDTAKTRLRRSVNRKARRMTAEQCRSIVLLAEMGSQTPQDRFVTALWKEHEKAKLS